MGKQNVSRAIPHLQISSHPCTRQSLLKTIVENRAFYTAVFT